MTRPRVESSRPAHDPQLPAEPYNPNVIGRLRKPMTFSPSRADHLAPRDEQEKGRTAVDLYNDAGSRRDAERD